MPGPCHPYDPGGLGWWKSAYKAGMTKRWADWDTMKAKRLPHDDPIGWPQAAIMGMLA